MSHRVFVLFVVAHFVALGIGMIALGVDAFLHSPILGEDSRLAGILLVFLGIGLVGMAASGIKMNFFTKTPATPTRPTT